MHPVMSDISPNKTLTLAKSCMCTLSFRPTAALKINAMRRQKIRRLSLGFYTVVVALPLLPQELAGS